jgi:hypothetical protein
MYEYSTLILGRFKRMLNFSTDFGKNIKISNFMKIRPVGAELFNTDGRTEEQTKDTLT